MSENNEDLSVVVDGNVNLSSKGLIDIPVMFSVVNGIDENNLSTLEGCPIEVGGGFFCGGNKLTSLEYSPEYVGGNFSCSVNCLTNLVGCPSEVGGGFFCHDNKLSTLEFCSGFIGGDFECKNNNINESELFLYDCSHDQISKYYINKNLNEKLRLNLDKMDNTVVSRKKI